ncbi:repressor protein factoR [Caudoviricetes sp.]|nr:repressor protein factoR [Caudoviricetes sp.]
MTPIQLLQHFKHNKSLASRVIGCSRATLGNWDKAKKIPDQWQALIQVKTGGKLKANS